MQFLVLIFVRFLTVDVNMFIIISPPPADDYNHNIMYTYDFRPKL